MAHVPMDDINELWNDNSAHSWAGLQQVLEQHRGKAEGISENLIDMLLPIAKDMEDAGDPYPSSPEELYDALNDHLGDQGNGEDEE